MLRLHAGNGALQSIGNNLLNETDGTHHQPCADLGVGNVPTQSLGRDDLTGDTGGNLVVGNVAHNHSEEMTCWMGQYPPASV